jgi:hypothetical protein
MLTDKTRPAEDYDVLHRRRRTSPRLVRFYWASGLSDRAMQPLLVGFLCDFDTIFYRFEGQLMARSGSKLNFRFGQDHRTFLSLKEFHYLTLCGTSLGQRPLHSAIC